MGSDLPPKHQYASFNFIKCILRRPRHSAAEKQSEEVEADVAEAAAQD